MRTLLTVALLFLAACGHPNIPRERLEKAEEIVIRLEGKERLLVMCEVSSPYRRIDPSITEGWNQCCGESGPNSRCRREKFERWVEKNLPQVRARLEQAKRFSTTRPVLSASE